MLRFPILALAVCAASSPAFAQDMPLAQILIDGEGWKKVAAPGAKPQPRPLKLEFPHSGPAPLAGTLSADGTTFYLARAGARSLLAAPATGASPPVPYAPLRLPHKEKGIDVTGLAADRAGRIYAATALGVQVFDPTGRLCGVLTPAAPGVPEHFAFEGDQLTLWIGGAKYVRKLNAQSAESPPPTQQ